jgi:hypothetical protein
MEKGNSNKVEVRIFVLSTSPRWYRKCLMVQEEFEILAFSVLQSSLSETSCWQKSVHNVDGRNMKEQADVSIRCDLVLANDLGFKLTGLLEVVQIMFHCINLLKIKKH